VALRLLIVDDNAAFLAASQAILYGPELSVVGEAATAAEALQRAQELQPDLVLLDIDLGEESGFDVARQLAASTGSAAPHMIFISAHPPEDFADIVADSPALGLIPKAELSPAAVTDVLRSRRTASDDGNQRESK
jgi:DNA-binding NarL/FixJ family response regulator